MTHLRLVHSIPGQAGDGLCEAGVPPADRSSPSVGGPAIAWNGDAGVAADGATIELRLGAVSRRVIVTVRRPGEHDQVGSGRTVEEAKDFAERILAGGGGG